MTRSFYLNHTHFIVMLVAALAIHAVMGIVWGMAPGSKVTKIPVHVLNIKLGSGDISELDASPKAGSAKMVANPSLSRPPYINERSVDSTSRKKKPEVEKAPHTQKENTATVFEQAETPDKKRSGSASLAPLSAGANPSQYVRGSGTGAGSGLGTSAEQEAEMMQRYTQLISLWINRYSAILNKSLQPGMKGNVIIRLRIDRAGKIHYFKLDKATGVPAVDAAAAQMVRAANPVPPVPSNYPGGNMFEFLIPVGYTFQQ